MCVCYICPSIYVGFIFYLHRSFATIFFFIPNNNSDNAEESLVQTEKYKIFNKYPIGVQYNNNAIMSNVFQYVASYIPDCTKDERVSFLPFRKLPISSDIMSPLQDLSLMNSFDYLGNRYVFRNIVRFAFKINTHVVCSVLFSIQMKMMIGVRNFRNIKNL